MGKKKDHVEPDGDDGYSPDAHLIYGQSQDPRWDYSHHLEALVFSFLDDLDSKMGAARAALAADSGDEMWSAFVNALGRKFLRPEVFCKEDSATKPPAQLTLTATAGFDEEK